MRQFLNLLLIPLFLIGCEVVGPKTITPEANFDYQLADEKLGSIITVFPAQEPIKFINKSVAATSFHWEASNGDQSNEKEPTFTFQSPGNYIVRLTAESTTGDKQVIIKQIKVAWRILDKITIQSLNWNAIGSLPSWSSDKVSDLNVEVGLKIASDPTNALFHLLYKTPKVANVSAAVVPIQIPVTEKISFEPNLLPALIIDLYGVDETGKYLSFSSGKVKSDLTASYDPNTGLYSITSSSGGTQIKLEYRYE